VGLQLRGHAFLTNGKLCMGHHLLKVSHTDFDKEFEQRWNPMSFLGGGEMATPSSWPSLGAVGRCAVPSAAGIDALALNNGVPDGCQNAAKPVSYQSQRNGAPATAVDPEAFLLSGERQQFRTAFSLGGWGICECLSGGELMGRPGSFPNVCC